MSGSRPSITGEGKGIGVWWEIARERQGVVRADTGCLLIQEGEGGIEVENKMLQRGLG